MLCYHGLLRCLFTNRNVLPNLQAFFPWLAALVGASAAIKVHHHQAPSEAWERQRGRDSGTMTGQE